MPTFELQTWISIGGVLATLCSTALAIFFFLRQRRIKKPYFASRGVTVFQNLTEQFPELEVNYGGSPVSQLGFTRLIFWNRGTEIINAVDVAEADRIRVSAKEGVTILTV